MLGAPLKFEPALSRAVDFSRIRGQPRAKQGALLCAAGGHNLLMIGAVLGQTETAGNSRSWNPLGPLPVPALRRN